MRLESVQFVRQPQLHVGQTTKVSSPTTTLTPLKHDEVSFRGQVAPYATADADVKAIDLLLRQGAGVSLGRYTPPNEQPFEVFQVKPNTNQEPLFAKLKPILTSWQFDQPNATGLVDPEYLTRYKATLLAQMDERYPNPNRPLLVVMNYPKPDSPVLNTVMQYKVYVPDVTMPGILQQHAYVKHPDTTDKPYAPAQALALTDAAITVSNGLNTSGIMDLAGELAAGLIRSGILSADPGLEFIFNIGGKPRPPLDPPWTDDKRMGTVSLFDLSPYERYLTSGNVDELNTAVANQIAVINAFRTKHPSVLPQLTPVAEREPFEPEYLRLPESLDLRQSDSYTQFARNPLDIAIKVELAKIKA